MKFLIVVAACAALVPAAASAQSGWVDMDDSNDSAFEAPAFSSAPRTTRTYDWRSGNSYSTTVESDGSTTMRGNNYQNGSTWRTKIDPDGDMRGTDANGNYWRYNKSTGSYYNSDGTTCYGKGYARSCN